MDNTPDPKLHHPQRTKRAVIVPVMGCTCAGKSTFMQYARSVEDERIGIVEVGKMLRAKYSPSAFEGKANSPKHAVEAWELFMKCVDDLLNAGKTLILIDGQPRDMQQLEDMLTLFGNHHTLIFVLLHASLEVREHRARTFRADTPENLELALQRLRNDMVLYYDLLVNLWLRRQHILFMDTGHPNYDFSLILDELRELAA